MKKILFAILLLILILVSFLNIKQSSWMKAGEMQEKVTNKAPDVYPGESEKQDYHTPVVYDINSLKPDSKLPGLKLNPAKDTLYTFSNTVSVTIDLPERISSADIILLNNGLEKDLFSGVSTGSYTFRNIFLDDSVNNLQFFYRVGNRRSAPEKIVVIKECCGKK